MERGTLPMMPFEICMSDVLGAAPGIAALIPFGSAARGQLCSDSDVDVAVIFDHASIPSDEERLLLRQRLKEALQRDVDLVVLNDAPIILAYQALKHGQVIGCPNPRVYHKFIMRLVTEYTDFKRVRKPIEDAVIKRRVLRDRS